MTEQSLIANIDSSLQSQILSMLSNVIDELDITHPNISSNTDSTSATDINVVNSNVNLPHLQLTNINPVHTYYNNNNSNFLLHKQQQHHFNQQHQHSFQLQLPHQQQQQHIPLLHENQIFSQYECDLATNGGITEELFIKYKSSLYEYIPVVPP